MAHFAELNSDNIVQQVMVISNDVAPDPAPDNEQQGQAYIADVLGLAGTWKQTSYNGNFRGNYAGIGYTYDEARDAFIAPEPPDAIGFDEDTLTWIVPEPELPVEEPAP
jgi:hypothetical protein